jgi:hypothetical protein
MDAKNMKFHVPHLGLIAKIGGVEKMQNKNHLLKKFKHDS